MPNMSRRISWRHKVHQMFTRSKKLTHGRYSRIIAQRRRGARHADAKLDARLRTPPAEESEMSVLLKSDERYFEISDEDLARSAIPVEDFEMKSNALDVADRNLVFDAYSEAVQIGCGCCTDKSSYNASCR
jgi:hypothetical protein